MLYNLQALRLFAALAVMLFHFVAHMEVIGWAGAGQWLAGMGYAGVDVFFVISGYVIWLSTQSLRGHGLAIEFAYRRLCRIFSGYWPYLGLMALVAWFFHPEILHRTEILRSILLLYTPIPERLLPVAWTLTYELYFYGWFALLIGLSNRWRIFALWLMAAWVLAVQLYALLIAGIYHPESYRTAGAFYRFYFSPFLLEFIAGALLAAYSHRLPKWAPVWPLLGAALLLMLAAWVQYSWLEASLAPGYNRIYRVILFGGASVLLLWALIAFEQCGWRPFGRMSLAMGDISYSLYLSHTIFLLAFEASGLRAVWTRHASIESAFLVLAVWVIFYSALHYYAIERPLYRSSRRVRFT